jgi:hypothetical protein
MKMNAEKLYLTASAVLTIALITTSASATKSVEITNAPSSNNFSQDKTYTASGTMDKKMALMLTNLLRNPHLQVRAEINGQALQTINPNLSLKNPMDILANYTITGKTDRKTVLKLKRLLQNNQQLQISAKATFSNNTHNVAQHTNAPAFQSRPQFIPAYTPFYSNITPPAYIQGNTLWMPIMINQPTASVPRPNTAELIAAN